MGLTYGAPLEGKVAVVTGANSGLGLETARALATDGATVIMACRSVEKAKAAKEAIEREPLSGSLEVVELDLASLESVRRGADQILQRHPILDLLINNAGVMAIPLRRTVEGFEMQFGTNHLGHFALTGHLLDALTAAKDGARVVSVSSFAHWGGGIRLDDINWERRYFRWPAYSQSKLANILFARELHRRVEEAGLSILSSACHPGASATNLQFVASELDGSKVMRKLWGFVNRFTQSAADGARPQLFAATSPDALPNGYYGPDGFGEISGDAAPARLSKRAKDAELARNLWELSEELTSVRYSFGR